MHYWKVTDKAAVLSGLSGQGYRLVDVQGNSLEFSAESLPERNSQTIWNIPAGKYQPVNIEREP